MTYISLDAELEGIDGFPAYEIGDYLDNSQDCRAVTVGNYDDEQRYHLAAEVDEEQADYLYLVTVDVVGDVILDDMYEAVEDTDMDVIFDYYVGEYIIARKV